MQREEVDRAATYVFATSGMTATSGGTGVLIYVSLFERRVVVLAEALPADSEKNPDELSNRVLQFHPRP
jgi:uncharacterized membrane protein